ncbi:MAG: ribose 5-phosphate isomerase B [Pseudomonadota bacterium]
MIALGSDHAGLQLKRSVVQHLETRGFEVADLGTHDAQSCDYPDLAKAVGERVARGAADLGVLVCGTGTGMAIAANKVPGVRAAMCCSELQARLARGHNDANVLCLGQRLQGEALAQAIVDAFVDTAFEGERHGRRVRLISDMERAAPR